MPKKTDTDRLSALLGSVDEALREDGLAMQRFMTTSKSKAPLIEGLATGK